MPGIHPHRLSIHPAIRSCNGNIARTRLPAADHSNRQTESHSPATNRLDRQPGMCIFSACLALASKAGLPIEVGERLQSLALFDL